ncbi:MAG: hypothetical protein ACXVAD_07095 [Syntrophales bacterium]
MYLKDTSFVQMAFISLDISVVAAIHNPLFLRGYGGCDGSS